MQDLIECKDALRKLPLNKFDDATEELINRALIRLDIVIRDRQRTIEKIRQANLAELQG